MDPLTLAMFAVLALLIYMMFRNNRKRKQQMEELKSQIQPGVEVMTNFGLYGTLVSIDEAAKVAELETSPGSIVRVHSQTIAKVVPEFVDDGEPRSVEEAMERADREQKEREAQEAAAADKPEGEPKETKAARRPSKKADE